MAERKEAGMRPPVELDVHTEHCCVVHGCKYGDDDCPVTTGRKPQSFPCEDCADVHALTSPSPASTVRMEFPEATSTFKEALAYIRPHEFTNGDAPVILKAGMLRCCVSAILMREANLVSRLSAAEAGREEAEVARDALAIEAARLEIQRDAALARVERLEEALRTVDQDARDHIRSDEIAPALLRPHALRAVRQALSDPGRPDLKETREGDEP